MQLLQFIFSLLGVTWCCSQAQRVESPKSPEKVSISWRVTRVASGKFSSRVKGKQFQPHVGSRTEQAGEEGWREWDEKRGMRKPLADWKSTRQGRNLPSLSLALSLSLLLFTYSLATHPCALAVRQMWLESVVRCVLTRDVPSFLVYSGVQRKFCLLRMWLVPGERGADTTHNEKERGYKS